MNFKKTFLALGLVALTLSGGVYISDASAQSPASYQDYRQWRSVQLARLRAARDRGQISDSEYKRYEWNVNSMGSKRRFNNNWNRQYGSWYNNYYNQHPNAWRYQYNNGRYNNNYNNDSLEDLRDFFNNFTGRY